MNHGEIADARFNEGCNCAQAVFTAFCDVTGLSRPEAMRLSSSFGGGVGRMREICGALSGAFLVLGWLYGSEEPGDDSVKAAHYARVQALAEAFRREHGSILCRELLCRAGPESPVPEARTAAYYAGRPCAALVGSAAEIFETYLAEHPPERREHPSISK